jgi:hypothetical protein
MTLSYISVEYSYANDIQLYYGIDIDNNRIILSNRGTQGIRNLMYDAYGL